MVENNPSDVKLDENPDGTVSFATDVVATIAGLAATEVEGVASMSSPSSALADMFSRKNTRNFTKGVRIDLDGNCVTVDVTIVVEYGSPVPDVARSIQENVKKAIETMTGMSVKSVDVHVTGVSFERENRAVAELEMNQRKLLGKEAPGAKNEEPADKAPETSEEEAAADDGDFELDLEDVEDDEEEEGEEPKDGGIEEAAAEAMEAHRNRSLCGAWSGGRRAADVQLRRKKLRAFAGARPCAGGVLRAGVHDRAALRTGAAGAHDHTAP